MVSLMEDSERFAPDEVSAEMRDDMMDALWELRAELDSHSAGACEAVNAEDIPDPLLLALHSVLEEMSQQFTEFLISSQAQSDMLRYEFFSRLAGDPTAFSEDEWSENLLPSITKDEWTFARASAAQFQGNSEGLARLVGIVCGSTNRRIPPPSNPHRI